MTIDDLADLQQAVDAANQNPIDDAPVDLVDTTKHPSGIVPQLQNVVATVNLGVPLDLKQIALHARNAEYNPKRFAAVIMRIREPKTTALIFASGKMVCTGAKSEDDSRLAARKYCRIVQKLGFNAEFKEFRVQNMVGSCDVKFPIRLEGIAYSHGYFATYEPELFPGLIYRMKQPKIVLLIFVSGKVVLTGAKKREEIYEAFEAIHPTLQQFRKQDGVAGMTAALLPSADGAGPSGSGAAEPVGGGGAGGQEATMPPPPVRGGGGASMPPPPAPALPPPSPAHPSMAPGPSIPPPTPHYVPPATPAYVPPATPSYVPPATPASYVPPATPAYVAPANPSAYMPPPPPQAPRMPPPPSQ